MTQPETCDAAGDAISLWLRCNSCPYGGILSSQNAVDDYTSGSVISCLSSFMSCQILMSFYIYLSLNYSIP